VTTDEHRVLAETETDKQMETDRGRQRQTETDRGGRRQTRNKGGQRQTDADTVADPQRSTET
jgi:hypothetical protein